MNPKLLSKSQSKVEPDHYIQTLMFRDLQSPLIAPITHEIFWLFDRCVFPCKRFINIHTKSFAVVNSFSRKILNEKINVWLFWKSIDSWYAANKYIFSSGYVKAQLICCQLFLMLTRSWLNYISVSLIDFPATVMLVSFAKSLDVEFFRQVSDHLYILRIVEVQGSPPAELRSVSSILS